MSTLSPRVADTVLDGLKDFQRRTVERVFERLYVAPDASRRFLVADEVGLGKTLVARGLIACAIDHLRDQGVRRIDVLYICSNGDIARQNIQRLKLDGDNHVAIASRLTLLPLEIRKLKEAPTGVNFISFTPGTSFDLAGGLGQVNERVLLFWMLREAWGLESSKAAMNVFQGHVGTERFRKLVQDFDREQIDGDSHTAFAKALKKRVPAKGSRGRERLRMQFDELCQAYSRFDRAIDAETARARNGFVGEMRAVLAESCIEPLEPDLVILDEFQRFSHLLESEDSDAATLARAVFEHPDVRVLLLSATPYKMYTLDGDSADEDHYRDFVRTVRFLEGIAAPEHTVEQELQGYGAAILGVTRADGVERLRKAKRRLEDRLRQVMVRTERLASTPDRNGMLVEIAAKPLGLRTSDALDYLAVQAVARVLDQPDALEYWKSTPYALSFLDDGYKLKTELRKALDVGEQRMKVARALSISPTATLSWPDVRGYKEVDGGNPRMRALMADVIDSGAYRLLWIPPAIPHYALGGAYAVESAARITKRLVFSSWRVVPRAIAAFLSYEVERRLFQGISGAEYTPEFRKTRRPLLRFAKDKDGRLTGMPVLALLYPSLYLAEACDPAQLSVEIAEEPSRSGTPSRVRDVSVVDVLKIAMDRIALAVERHLPAAPTIGPVDERWYWAAPLLLDRKLRPATTLAWFQQENLAEEWSGVGEDDHQEKDEGTAHGGPAHWAEHVAEAREVAVLGAAASSSTEGRTALGRRPEDLVQVLAQIAISGPAVTMLRALLHVLGGESALDERVRTVLRNGAGQIAWAFRALFNQPEVRALISGLAPDDGGTAYWRQVLGYCVDGGLQAVLDEYVHVLRDHRGLIGGSVCERVEEIVEEMIDAIALRTSRVGIDDLAVSDTGRTVHRESRNLRTHFALRYGDEKSDDGQIVTRADQVRRAFNSPFWPFVLATTSVGQEGLDFHTYCHAVMHWNLPSNPVDLEQREGRVHRYKGHAVRKNVAQVHADRALRGDARDRWETVFAHAKAARVADASDIVPYWIHLGGDARIERHVPALPLSLDITRAERLRASLAVYRMVFGQPRQEDLMAYLLERVPIEDMPSLMEELRIRLGPSESGA